MNSRDQANRDLVAAVNKNDAMKAQHALDAGADANFHDYNNEPSLQVAAANGFHEIVKVLLDGGAKAEGVAKSGYHSNPLYFAINGGHTEVVRTMLSSDFYHVDVNTYLYHSVTPLKFAASEGQLEMVKLLLSHGAKADYGYSDHNGISALSCAAGPDRVEIARVLVKAGADVNAKEVCRNTPLHAAAESGDLDLARYLVENGADIGAVNKYDETPANVAAGKGHQQVVKFLKSAHDEQVNAKLKSKVSSHSLFGSSQAAAVTATALSDAKLLEMMKTHPEDVLAVLKSIDECLVSQVVAQVEARRTHKAICY